MNDDLFIDESMIKNIKDYNQIKDEITCEICQGILIRPKQCISCETNYCEKCINNWLSRNNSCPKRCSEFSIKESSKLMKKLLDKLVIQCKLCKNNFNYETFVFKHFEKCAEERKMIKCPFCPNCKIKFKELEEYNNNLNKEKNELLKEIEKLKDKIKVLESNSKNKLKWSNVQKFQTYELSKDDKTIKIRFDDCYKIYLLDNEFSEKESYTFGIHINTFGKLYDYMALGFINEQFDYECLCCRPKNAFYIRIDEDSIYYNDKKISTKLDNKTNFKLKFILNLNQNKLEIKNYDTNKSYGIVDVDGITFKFFVSKCNYGIIEYTILP